MVFNSGTGITTHIAMLDKLIEVVTSRNLTAVAVNNGGSGHAVGDIIDITATGSTSTEVARLEVTSVSAGVIDGIRVYRGGAYTVDPSTTTGNAQSATTGSGTGATFDLTFSAATWTQNRRSQEAASAAIGDGGTGYTVNDTLTVVLNDGVDGDGYVAAQFNVDSVSSGVITAVSVVTAGNYEEVPTNDVTVTGGTGSGAELTVTWQNSTTDGVAMLEGEGSSGTDEIHVGIKTYEAANGFDTAYNWAMYGMTGYTASVEFHNQPGIDSTQIDSDGTLPSTDRNAVMVLKPNDADPDIDWWIHHNGRRIIVVCRVRSATTDFWFSGYMGFLAQIATETAYPYPLCIIGGTTDQNRLWSDNSNLTGGIVESIDIQTGDPNGPGFLRLADGTWMPFAAEGSSIPSVRQVETEFGIYPFINRQNLGVAADRVVQNTSDVDFTGGAHDIIPNSGVPGSPGILLKPTPGTGDDYYWLFPPIVCRFETFPTTYNVFGELDGVVWFTNGGNSIVSGDRFVLGSKRYSVFQNGNRTQNWSYFAIDED